MLSEKSLKGIFLEALVGGNLLILGLWYLNRPFLLQNFPNAAADAAAAGAQGLGGKLLLLSLSSFIAAIFLTHLVDVVIPLIVGGPIYIEKRHKFIKSIIVRSFRIFTFTQEEDPRIISVRRYILSDRKSWFLAMASDWGKTSEAALESSSEIVKLHQHITTRLRVISDASRDSLRDAYGEIMFSGSVFVALIILTFASLVSIYLNSTVVEVSTHAGLSMWIIASFIYFSAIISGFLFRRRLRTFYNQIITLGLHFYDASKVPPPSRQGYRPRSPRLLAPETR